MGDRLLSTFFGILMGFCVPLFLWVLFAEHLTFFILVPILPIVGILIGFLFGVFRRIPPYKIWVSLLIFTIFIGASIGFSEIRDLMVHVRREQVAYTLLMKYPGTKITEKKYSGGNGMEYPPNVTFFIEVDTSFVEMAKYFDDYFGKNGWQKRHSDQSALLSWQKNNTEVFLSNKNRRSPTIEFRVDYWGYWLTLFSKI